MLNQRTSGNAPAQGRGFTLVELVVVIFIIGVLAAIAIPYYILSEENSKAMDAQATAAMVASANRMYAVDHPISGSSNGTYLNGTLTTNACGNTCVGTCGSCNNACDLIGCGYLAAKDWTNSPYAVATCNPGASCTSANTGCSGNLTACTWRQWPANSSVMSPYNTWGYTVDSNGIMYNNIGTNTPAVLH